MIDNKDYFGELLKERGCFLPQMEEWKPLKNYEGLYEISNYGSIKGLIKPGNWRERILVKGMTHDGYPSVVLNKNSRWGTHTIHTLIWDAFGDKPRDGHRLQVDHINNDRTYFLVHNLQLLNEFQNMGKSRRRMKSSSRFVGVYHRKDNGHWNAYIQHNKRRLHIGQFKTEIEAALAREKYMISNSISY